jgi:hypothetical protein
MIRIRAPQDLGAALIFLIVGVAGLWFGRDLPGMGSNGQLGSGTAPRILSWVCIAYTVLLLVKAVRLDGPAIAEVPWRAAAAVTASTVVFGALVESIGYLPAAFIVPLVATLAVADIRWKEALVFAALLAAGTAILFITLLGQPMLYVGGAP